MWHIRDFRAADQAAAFALIAAGLTQRFGFFLEGINPDIDDIHAHYIAKGDVFVVVEKAGAIIGCGAVIAEPDTENTARIVRVSVAADQQGQGIGRGISEHLLGRAKAMGYAEVLVETNHDWHSALRLYQSLGFAEYMRKPIPEYGYTEVHMRLGL